MNTADTLRPWYREPWLWFVIALPLSAVIAGVTTVFIAAAGDDALVVDDFSKIGLVARRETALEREAERLHVSAVASIDRASGQLVLRLAGDSHPDTLRVGLFHPTRRAFDRETVLRRDDAGIYRGSVGANIAGHWHVQIADGPGLWRLTGRLADDATLLRIGDSP